MKLARSWWLVGLVGLTVAAASAHAPAPQEGGRLFGLSYTTGPGWDQARPPTEQRFWAEHSANMRRLRNEGHILVGGRFGAVGLFVVRAADSTAARALLAPDSSVAHGVFRVAIDRWSTVYDGTLPPR